MILMRFHHYSACTGNDWSKLIVCYWHNWADSSSHKCPWSQEATEIVESDDEANRDWESLSTAFLLHWDAVKQMSDLILITPCVESAALVDLPIITTNSNKIPAIP